MSPGSFPSVKKYCGGYIHPEHTFRKKTGEQDKIPVSELWLLLLGIAV